MGGKNTRQKKPKNDAPKPGTLRKTYMADNYKESARYSIDQVEAGDRVATSVTCKYCNSRATRTSPKSERNIPLTFYRLHVHCPERGALRSRPCPLYERVKDAASYIDMGTYHKGNK